MRRKRTEVCSGIFYRLVYSRRFFTLKSKPSEFYSDYSNNNNYSIVILTVSVTFQKEFDNSDGHVCSWLSSVVYRSDEICIKNIYFRYSLSARVRDKPTSDDRPATCRVIYKLSRAATAHFSGLRLSAGAVGLLILLPPPHRHTSE